MSAGKPKRRGWLLLCFAALLLVGLLSPTAASAAEGDLDASFGTAGKVTTDFGTGWVDAYGMAVDAQNRIVLGGCTGSGFEDLDFALARYNRDGSLDASFDTDGKVTTDFGGTHGECGYALAIGPDGDIVLGGATTDYSGDLNDTYDDFALARYNPDGSPDTSFGAGGKVTTHFTADSSEWVYGLAFDGEGRIVVAGETDSKVALARYTTTGSLDVTFDTDGKVTTDFVGSYVDQANGVAIAPDGDIVVAGEVWTARPPEAGGSAVDFALARYTATGGLDATFDTDGKVTTDFGGVTPPYDQDAANALAILPGGDMLVAGDSNSGGSAGGGINFALARYNGTGGLDSSFGAGGADGDGRVTTDFEFLPGTAGGNDSARSLTIDAQNRIVLGGDALNGELFGLARYTSAGVLDSSFGAGGDEGDGRVRTDFGGPAPASAAAVAIDAKSRIILGGYGSDDFALARYVGDASVSLAPVVTIDSGPAAGATITGSTPTFGFSSDEDPGASFQCSLDGVSWSACSGPGNTHTTAALADGSHTFYVRGTDRAGRIGDPVGRTFIVSVPQLPPDGTVPPPDGTVPPSDGSTPPPGLDEYTRTLSLSYSAKKDKFKGELASTEAACVAAQKVSVYEKAKGADPKLGSPKTDDAGKYSLKEKKAEGKFYASVKETSTSAGTCLAAKSKTVKVG